MKWKEKIDGLTFRIATFDLNPITLRLAQNEVNRIISNEIIEKLIEDIPGGYAPPQNMDKLKQQLRERWLS